MSKIFEVGVEIETGNYWKRPADGKVLSIYQKLFSMGPIPNGDGGNPVIVAQPHNINGLVSGFMKLDAIYDYDPTIGEMSVQSRVSLDDISVYLGPNDIEVQSPYRGVGGLTRLNLHVLVSYVKDPEFMLTNNDPGVKIDNVYVLLSGGILNANATGENGEDGSKVHFAQITQANLNADNAAGITAENTLDNPLAGAIPEEKQIFDPAAGGSGVLIWIETPGTNPVVRRFFYRTYAQLVEDEKFYFNEDYEINGFAAAKPNLYAALIS